MIFCFSIFVYILGLSDHKSIRVAKFYWSEILLDCSIWNYMTPSYYRALRNWKYEFWCKLGQAKISGKFITYRTCTSFCFYVIIHSGEHGYYQSTVQSINHYLSELLTVGKWNFWTLHSMSALPTFSQRW